MMPPIADKHLEEKILRAAQRLWRARGEKGLTLRAVAREAGTTTPTLYKRFRNKESLRLALAARFRDELIQELFASSDYTQMHRKYLAYAETHPREYELLRVSWGHFFSGPRPVLAWISGQLAIRFGGQPKDYERVYDALFLLCHGASTLMTSAPNDDVLTATREICVNVCDKLLENALLLRVSA
jgi:AcrR family transcriptional regulator